MQPNSEVLHDRNVHGRARAPFTSVLSGELLMRLLARATAPSAADTAAFRIVMPASAPRYKVFMDCEAAPRGSGGDGQPGQAQPLNTDDQGLDR
jgi:hypothetical protein